MGSYKRPAPSLENTDDPAVPVISVKQQLQKADWSSQCSSPAKTEEKPDALHQDQQVLYNMAVPDQVSSTSAAEHCEIWRHLFPDPPPEGQQQTDGTLCPHSDLHGPAASFSARAAQISVKPRHMRPNQPSSKVVMDSAAPAAIGQTEAASDVLNVSGPRWAEDAASRLASGGKGQSTTAAQDMASSTATSQETFSTSSQDEENPRGGRKHAKHSPNGTSEGWLVLGFIRLNN